MNRLLKLGLSVAASLALVAVVASFSGAANTSLEAQFVASVNAQRSSAGLRSLVVDPRLVAAAQTWSDHLLATGTVSDNPGILAQAPPGAVAVAENAGVGMTVAQLIQAFMNSPEHRVNILGNFDAIGVGVDPKPNGTLVVTMDFARWGAGAAPPSTCTSNGPAVAAPAGYYVLGGDGNVVTSGPAAPFAGSPAAAGNREPTVALVAWPGRGYDVLAASGRVSSFGGAPALGFQPMTRPGVTATDLRPTPNGAGYWIMDSTGGVFSFGNAPFLGSVPGLGVSARAVSLVPSPTGRGYWILAADGGVFSFGDARFVGSLPGAGLRQGAAAMAGTPSGQGYWILDHAGGVFSFGDAGYFGSLPGLGCAGAPMGIVPARNGSGYAVLRSDGRVFGFGSAPSWTAPALGGVGLAATGI